MKHDDFVRNGESTSSAQDIQDIFLEPSLVNRDCR